jgi:meiotically up-regulated gene 157 (Mug157) protein
MAMGAATKPSTGLFSKSRGRELVIPEARPPYAIRRFRSAVVEQYMTDISGRIGDPGLATLFRNCFPNTLDTTVQPGTFDGKPDTVVITGDIEAMWLRDSSAQVWPYLPLASKDDNLRVLLEGVIRRQTRCILIDPYANAFMVNLKETTPLSWSVHDETVMRPGVGQREWELDSLCYPVRLAYGYWKQTGDTSPFDSNWHEGLRVVVRTMRDQQRKHDQGAYQFYGEGEPKGLENPDGYGTPVRPVGLIASRFRPSDDVCEDQFLIPSNLFAVTALEMLAEMAHRVLHDGALAKDADSLAKEVRGALMQYGLATTEAGTIWAFEVDGFGKQLLMDDANVPSLLGLPYLQSSQDAAIYARTRAFVWSKKNPWFFRGTAGEGIGSPHTGPDTIWPMSQIIYALTSTSDDEIRRCLAMLKVSSAGTGFMHESFNKDDPAKFTRSWFAWVNTLFGELIALLAMRNPELLKA